MTTNPNAEALNLFQVGDFTLHSGQQSRWKIDCGALTLLDWEALAHIGMEKMGWPKFYTVEGIPQGGLKLAQALGKYQTDEGWPLVVDDVLTTGESMKAYKEQYPYAFGLVVFARGECPAWITPIFQM